MSQWKKDDSAANSVLWAGTGFNLAPNTTNQTNLFSNVTADAFITGLTIGQFGVDTTEIGVGSGAIIQAFITNAGSGYGASGITAALSGGGGASGNVTFSSTGGRVSGYTINNGGSSYETNPTVTVSAPPVYTFNGNTAVSTNTITIASANTKFTVGDKVTYTGNSASTPYPLVSGSNYYVVTANSTTLRLSDTQTGAAITFTGAPVSAQAGGASLQGETATAAVVVGGAQNKGVAHTGWVIRKVGSGGRAGRVQYETLVAMGSMTNAGGDAEDSVLPDS